MRGVGIGNALFQAGIGLVLCIVIGGFLAPGIRRIADDDLNGGVLLGLYPFGILRQGGRIERL